MVRTMVSICDHPSCTSTLVTCYEVKVGGGNAERSGTYMVELCDKHEVPLLTLLNMGAFRRKSGPTPNRPSGLAAMESWIKD